MTKFLVEVSYLQWGSVELKAKNEEEALAMADDLDLESYKETNITDFKIMDIRKIKWKDTLCKH